MNLIQVGYAIRYEDGTFSHGNGCVSGIKIYKSSQTAFAAQKRCKKKDVEFCVVGIWAEIDSVWSESLVAKEEEQYGRPEDVS